jgi:uncharacterized low-complexity protein
MKLGKIFYKNIQILLGVLFLSYSTFSFAQDNNIDAQINNILKASPSEKEQLIKDLKSDVSEIKYNNTEDKDSSIISKNIDEKIQNRESKSITMSKCGAGKCGMGKCGMSTKVKPGKSHGSKCGTPASKCGGGTSHGSKCGSGKCGMGN